MENQGEKIIHIKGLVFEYETEGGARRALDTVELEIERGSFTSIIGRNGSGKSTLARNINALLTPTAGCVLVGGYDTREDAYLWEIRRMAGMVFQNPDNQLVSAVVEDDVAFGPENLGLPREEILERVHSALESVDMLEQRKMAPHLLSGGQKQRIAIAGVVAMKPEIIILDEPTAMLDPEGRAEVLEIAARLCAEGITILMVTHFMEETLSSDRIIIMEQGRILMDGSPTEVFSRADELQALGLKLPFAVALAERLRVRGVLSPGAPILQEAVLAEEILRSSSGMDFSKRTQQQKTVSPAAAVRSIIVCEHLTHTYSKGLAYETSAVEDVSFEVAAGEYIAIIGHTGSGKSTLIQHLNGLLRPTDGRILVDGIDLSEKKNIAVLEVRKKIGMVFQYPEYQLFEETVYLDIAFGPKNLGASADEIDVRVREALSLAGMDFDEFAQRSPFELSGGQKRMVAIAGVLAMRPNVLVLDEPTAGLDPKAHENVLSLIDDIRSKTGATILLVSHNMEDVARLSDRVFVMASGRLVMSGSPAEVFADEAFLRSIGLAVPSATAFANRLKQGGLPLPSNILTLDALEKEMCS